MQLTFIGVLLLLIGLPIVIYGGVTALLGLLLGCSILGGSAAINLPALGGSSIPPIHFALALATLRIFLPGSGQAAQARGAIEANWPLIVYTLCGILLAIVGPRLFRGAMMVPPLKSIASPYLYAAEALRPTSQNITTSVYMVGTALCAVTVYVACAARGGAQALVRVAATVAWVNVALGVIVALIRNSPAEIIVELIRNGNYAQLDQTHGNFVRLSGLFPEASNYATYSFAWFCFLFECWYRDVMPRRTGAAALALFVVLLASTSSTAYLGLGAYAVVLTARMLLPGAARSDKLLGMGLAVMLGAMLAALVFFILPALGGAFVDMVEAMTVGKSQSASALQRAFWARKGLEAFAVSHGFGIGAGSFRSSSLLTAILGSTGVVGIVLVATHVLRILKPLRTSTFSPSVDMRTAIGAAAGWAGVMLFVPYSLVLPSCDLGTDFAMFSGAALALRALPRRRTAPLFPAPRGPAPMEVGP